MLGWAPSVGTTLLVLTLGHTTAQLNAPYGGVLRQLISDDPATVATLKDESALLTTITLGDRHLYDIEMLLNGAFSPLTGFMNKKTYERVVTEMRLPDEDGMGGLIWPMPITLDLEPEVAAVVVAERKVTIRDKFHNPLAILDVEESWEADKELEARSVYGTFDATHPAVAYLNSRSENSSTITYVGGRLRGIMLPQHFDFAEDRRTPAQVRAMLATRKQSKVVAFQTRNPMHLAHIELTKRAQKDLDATLLLTPVVGPTNPGDVHYTVRVACYKRVLAAGYWDDPSSVVMTLMPFAMRMAGPREALWHAIIRKNYGATHFIVGRDHAGCKSKLTKSDFYEPYAAQELVAKHTDEIGIQMAAYQEFSYVPEKQAYFQEHELEPGWTTKSLSGSEVRRRLGTSEEIPAWFSDPEVVRLLQASYPSKLTRGFALFFTGLSGAGKTTVAAALISVIKEKYNRQVTFLDGDVVRTHLSKELGFSRKDRDTNIARIAFVASEVVRHGGIVVICAIAPYEKARDDAKNMIRAATGGFFQIYLSTTVEVCKKRDVKGLYRRAEENKIQLTGVNDPFEVPAAPEIQINTGETAIGDAVIQILANVTEAGFLPPGR